MHVCEYVMNFYQMIYTEDTFHCIKNITTGMEITNTNIFIKNEYTDAFPFLKQGQGAKERYSCSRVAVEWGDYSITTCSAPAHVHKDTKTIT